MWQLSWHSFVKDIWNYRFNFQENIPQFRTCQTFQSLMLAGTIKLICAVAVTIGLCDPYRGLLLVDSCLQGIPPEIFTSRVHFRSSGRSLLIYCIGCSPRMSYWTQYQQVFHFRFFFHFIFFLFFLCFSERRETSAFISTKGDSSIFTSTICGRRKSGTLFFIVT